MSSVVYSLKLDRNITLHDLINIAFHLIYVATKNITPTLLVCDFNETRHDDSFGAQTGHHN